MNIKFWQSEMTTHTRTHTERVQNQSHPPMCETHSFSLTQENIYFLIEWHFATFTSFSIFILSFLWFAFPVKFVRACVGLAFSTSSWKSAFAVTKKDSQSQRGREKKGEEKNTTDTHVLCIASHFFCQHIWNMLLTAAHDDVCLSACMPFYLRMRA